MIEDEVLEEFAATLVPEAFERPTVAHRVDLEEAGAGRATFDEWVSTRLDEALAARWPGEAGRPTAVGALSDGRLRWWYDDGGCGLLDCVEAPMAREAAAVAEPWVFGAVLARPQGHRETAGAMGDGPVEEVWREPTRTFWQAAWYAEGRGRGVATTVAGLLHLEGEQVVDHRAIEVRESWVTDRLHRVLHRHPSRRRFPLRRRRTGG